MLILIALACSTIESVQHPPPVPGVSLSGDLVQGESAQVDISLPTPARRVWLLTSKAGPGAGPCRGSVCADLLDPEFLGPRDARPSGQVSFDVEVPASPTLWMQVVVLDQGQVLASQVFERQTLVEDCTNGVDDDFDGLADCEDAHCSTDAACVELDCDDGLDNDNDGVADCIDEDCWADHCARMIATVTSGSFAHRVWSYSQNFSLEMTWTNLRGNLRFESPNGTSSCAWWMDEMVVGGNQSPVFMSHTPVEMGAGCNRPPTQLMFGPPSTARSVSPAASWSRVNGRFGGNLDVRLPNGQWVPWLTTTRTFSFEQDGGFLTYSYGGGPLTWVPTRESSSRATVGGAQEWWLPVAPQPTYSYSWYYPYY